MFSFLFEQSKKMVVTLRFSILAIFVSLFLLSMLTLITVTHFRFIRSTQDLALNLMNQSSTTAYNDITNEFKNAEIKSQSAAQLIKFGLINADNQTELTTYTTSLMQDEMRLFPSVQSIVWGDDHGNLVIAEKRNDGSIHSEIVSYTRKKHSHISIERDITGKILKTVSLNAFTYDPRTRPWYITAKDAEKPTWLGIYESQLTGYLGTSISTPVYKNDGTLIGVLNLNLRLDNIRRMVEETKISKQSIVFIVTDKDKLVAFPKLVQFNRESLLNIHELKSTPWISESFDLYKKNNHRSFVFYSNKQEFFATYRPLSTFGQEHWMLGIVIPSNDFINDLRKTNLITIFINLGILIFGITVVSILTSRVVRPLKKITSEIVKIKNFNLKNNKRIQSHIKEIGYIADALYSMKKTLRIFQRYIPAALVRQLIQTGEDARIGGVKIPLAILFSDIRDFTSIAEKINPEELTPHICHYFDALTQIIVLNNGTIDKYIGDAIMAFWGAPQQIDQPAVPAAKAALRCIQRSNQLNKQWQAEGKPILYTRIGLHLGDAIVGNLGSSERINYTAIGDTINIASRLESINKIYGTQIIVSNSIYQEIKDHFILRLVDHVAAKDKQESSYLYELIAETRNEVSYDINQYNIAFTKGFSAYQTNQWDQAIASFRECLDIYPDDTVATIFIHRCENFKSNPPPADWNGIWQVSEK